MGHGDDINDRAPRRQLVKVNRVHGGAVGACLALGEAAEHFAGARLHGRRQGAPLDQVAEVGMGPRRVIRAAGNGEPASGEDAGAQFIEVGAIPIPTGVLSSLHF